MAQKVLLSGIQATGKLHFGNYFGAMKQNIDLANSGEYDAYIFIADYHALTTVKDRELLSTSSLEIAAAYIACGLDMSKAKLFRQSRVPEHAELAIILNNVVTMPYLMRAHAFKDHIAKDFEEINSQNVKEGGVYDASLTLIKVLENGENLYSLEQPLSSLIGKKIGNRVVGEKVNLGLFNYPVLMAADILIYKADIVPVGSDQKQHIEYARDIAGFYNRAWNVEEFQLPKEVILESVATIPGVDGKKMSKSKGNVISLFGTDEEVKKAVMSIVTDSAAPDEKKDPDTNNIYNIHKHFLNEQEISDLRAKFENGGYGYKAAKDDLLATVMKWREGKKETFDNLVAHPEKIQAVLEEGGRVAQVKARETMKEVRGQIGL
jgi:tryptophanyl-tRNA synthetase